MLSWFSARRAVAFVFVATLTFTCIAPAQAISDGCDLEFGGPGTGPGQFTVIKDFAFDRASNLYVLDGPKLDPKTKTYTGSRRIQKFDNEGRFLSERSLQDDAMGSAALGEKNLPQKLVVTAAGDVIVTQPEANRLWLFTADGNGRRSIPVDGCAAIAVPPYGKEGPIYVIDSRRGKGREWLGGDTIQAIKPDGSPGLSVGLQKKLDNVVDMAIDPQGNFVILADLNQIYVFNSTGRLLRTAGAGMSTRNEDGSEPLHSITVDGEGNVYAMTWGNPGLVTKYDASFTVVRQREGQFKWADPWSTHSSFVPLAVDPAGRLWASAPEPRDPKNVNFPRYRPTPAMIRMKDDFFASGGKGVRERSALLLGFKPSIKVDAPYNTVYDFAPIELSFAVAAANRQIDNVDVAYRVQDAFGLIVDQGKFDFALENGKEAVRPFKFKPPRYGWYTVTCDCSVDGKKLQSIGEHVGVTPAYAGMKAKLVAGEANGGWDDAPRQMFCGLTNMRLHPKLDAPGKTDNLDKMEHEATAAIKLGATVLLQFSDKKDCTPENIRRYVERLKGRVKYWEVMNEPNFSMSAEDYAKLLKESYAVIKSADPEAQVLGPSHCGISLEWIERFLKAGGAPYFDIFSVHDYEGHESIDATHWRWKFNALRQLLAVYNSDEKPIWQTERAISASRGGNFTGLVQAARTTLHRSLLESLDVAPRHNNHYYLNEGGYNTVPSYVWSRSGPYPAALALRTRYAYTEADGGRYVGPLEFNRWYDDNKILALVYERGDMQTIVLQTFGIPSLPIELEVGGDGPIDLYDPFGNHGTVDVVGGKAKFEAMQFPHYLVLPKSRTVKAVPLEHGKNFALRASVTYSAPSVNGLELINNGILETYCAGHPDGGTDGKKIWQGDWPTDPTAKPTLEFAFRAPRRINAAMIIGVQADNNFCALLDYDLEAEIAGKWMKIAELRTPLTPTDIVDHGQNAGNNWYDGRHRFVHRFDPVEATKMRLVVHRTTQGFAADDAATTILKQTWGGKGMPMKVMLREVEFYCATPEVSISRGHSWPIRDKTRRREIEVVVWNRSGVEVEKQLRAEAPPGWTLDRAEVSVVLPPGKSVRVPFNVDAPELVDVGRYPTDISLLGDGKLEDISEHFTDFYSPVAVQPQSPSALDVKRQPLSVVVKSALNSPRSGTIELKLVGPRSIECPAQEFGPIAVGATQTITFQVPDVDLALGPWTAVYTTVAEGIRTRTEQPLNVRLWSIIGPFEKDMEKVFGPEQTVATGVDLTKSHVDGFGNERKWRVVAGESNGMLNLTKHIVPKDNVSAYAVVFVESPTAQQAIFSTGTDDGGKAWLNGKLIMNDDSSHPASPGSTLVPVELKAGRNEVVFKIMQGNGGWGCYLDFLDVKTRVPLAGLIYRPTP